MQLFVRCYHHGQGTITSFGFAVDVINILTYNLYVGPIRHIRAHCVHSIPYRGPNTPKHQGVVTPGADFCERISLKITYNITTLTKLTE